MFIFTVEAFSVTASFRIPENHTFQQTLPLPPVTTLTGLMGAALGLSFEKAMQFRKEKGIFFGVIGSSEGKMRDLWKYNKIKTSYKEDGSDRQDILIREFLTDFSLILAVGAEDEKVITEIRSGFLNPRYALSAGNSDDLLKIRCITSVFKTEASQCSNFENTILAGNQTLQYESPKDLLENTAITYTIKAPQVFLLPVAFRFNGEERRVSERKQFTFVGSPIKLKESIKAYNVNERMFALL